ncbi:MAG: 50S ribosomal protein L15 [Omnitrophica bacterium RIFCSPLOWO2_02_FULL_45_16]|nr:MAG: 50S ribosomal protein L15 [Omnitrophica bacterium RIFCSPHIGHO2_02_FULL_46_20]OGW92563.1 MAG: 50S ribosomal protein L15 [Omnitrophica bacterium RIFCSPLOWO2_12_FULL_45_13]OGW93178.1 MAG: 50S ribosomal protein L15 [Omnitrophica bacterium RIFCSPLOWO2_01_FULL_45_24]OGX00144.1 MAG: 50S ribosomal protein L15 [Omnitrophica bacterium RIFCSPLOWO2_02_FULL_45_16]
MSGVKINEIGAPKGANRNTKRRGRGSGSGHGKTSCRGRKGAKKRSGRTTRPGFEGGQMQLVRRIPKRGFNAPFKNVYQVVNIESLNRFKENSTIGPEELKSAGLIGSVKEPIKILGGGDLKKVITVKAHKISENAKRKLASAGAKFDGLA